MSTSRLGGLRQGFENADAINRMMADQKARLQREGGGLSNETREGRGRILDHIAAERNLGAMMGTIRESVGGWATDQEVKDAAWLLNRASRW